MITRRSIFTKFGAALCGLFVGRASGATSVAKSAGQELLTVDYTELGADRQESGYTAYRLSTKHPGEIEYDGILHSDRLPCSRVVEVFDRNTGKIPEHIQAVYIPRECSGWIDQVQMGPTLDLTDQVVWKVRDGKRCHEPWTGLVIHRIYGNWGLRYKP